MVVVLVRETQVVQVGTTALGVPRVLVWDGVHHDVTDRPTRWSGRGDEWDFGPDGGADPTAGTARDPGDPGIGGMPALWRFQATPRTGDAPSVVVDVVGTSHGWVLLGVVR